MLNVARVCPVLVMIGMSRIQSCFSHQERFATYHAIVRSRPSSKDSRGRHPRSRSALLASAV